MEGRPGGSPLPLLPMGIVEWTDPSDAFASRSRWARLVFAER